MHSRGFKIQDEFQELCWVISKEQKIILGYKCQKATIEDYFGKSVEAWFTSQIPIQDGPMEFTGLPGLILELTANYLHFKAVNIDINRDSNITIEQPIKSSKSISIKEFYEKTRRIKTFGM